MLDLVSIAGAAFNDPLNAYMVRHFLRFGHLPGGSWKELPQDDDVDQAVAEIEAGATQAERQKALNALIANGQ